MWLDGEDVGLAVVCGLMVRTLDLLWYVA